RQGVPRPVRSGSRHGRRSPLQRRFGGTRRCCRRRIRGRVLRPLRRRRKDADPHHLRRRGRRAPDLADLLGGFGGGFGGGYSPPVKGGDIKSSTTLSF